ncbi:5-methyltetrahydropteroyltriglutamate--homocysteine S-methyltransferase [Alsobacter soli]|uniref:5-methyltetrahydropteroyltriglutamate--homocysteine S-methyltransferase n=1 Tax=Alsobacter soli TaxID=2109933 RepID=A0A2T1HX30_9HYPH|nr:5-methyltetrahydropteroyltriglutamate--homocysteine S-methyltransferase [Alsobacter soli]PSC06138.1 5-methyltetrahydropteroyltriglutamate--homocysteine S-methyltransferase [Alsobacter soli]
MTARSVPPFRADMVGSLLRPAALKEARAKRAAGEISAEELTAVEDREIAAVVAKQEAIGLKAVTDGEFRRSWWHYDFLWNLDGVTRVEVEQGIQFAGVQTKNEAPRVTGKIGFSGHPFLRHFRYLKEVSEKSGKGSVPKLTIPSPSMLHYRAGRKLINMGLYPDMEDFYADLGNAYGGAVQAFAGEGCRYLQLDDVSFAYLCDPEQRKMLADRGDDPEKQPHIYAGMINTAIKGRPSDMVISMHLCRGNFRSTFVASGGYEPIADLLFNEVNVDAYFMEWDTDRAGGFEPLRFLPKNKTVVLGLVTSKTGVLEKKDDIKRRIEEASRYAPLEQLCLSPQCGFASTEEGNTLAEEEQWAKLQMIVEISREVWG